LKKWPICLKTRRIDVGLITQHDCTWWVLSLSWGTQLQRQCHAEWPQEFQI
jgi:hypothetical protein